MLYFTHLLRVVLISICFFTVGAQQVSASIVRMLTPLGLIDIKLYDEQAPQTVTNFLNYVNRGDYDNSFVHRSVPDFVIQGGGFRVDFTTANVSAITTEPPVANEFSASRPNLRGTIAMAKLPDAPDSATSQWFFNLKDNSSELNAQNGGFTVFGQVMGRGMEIVDLIAQLGVVNAGGVFANLPLLTPPENGSATLAQLVLINKVAMLPTEAAEAVDRLFNYLEQKYPEFIFPTGNTTGQIEGYDYRYYPGTDAYIGARDSRLYYFGPASNNELQDIGNFDDWYMEALNAGY